MRRPITLEEVWNKLKQTNKPKSLVEGDMLPRLMRLCHADVALPAQMIFNAVFHTNCWPKRWKTETTVIIPKTPNPTGLNECRNISCTPFLSKVLESIVQDDIRAEIPIDPSQYGGLKQSSVDHLLVDLYEAVLHPLDDGGHPSLVLSIDYEKAFNRMDHRQCIEQLRALGTISVNHCVGLVFPL